MLLVGAERIELPTSCSQSKRATAALRPEKLARQEGLEPSTRGVEARCSDPLSYWRNWLLATLGAREISEPTLNPCVTRAGFRHLRTRHRLTTQLRAVKSHPRFPAATEIPEVRYCAQGFNVGPRCFPGVVRVQRLRQSAFVLRLGYIDPAESFAFPLPACTSPTLNRPGADLRDSSRDGHSASLPEAQPPTRHLAPSHVAHQPGRPGSMLVLV